MLRLALGTDESRRRTIVALADLWPYLDELFQDAPLDRPPGRCAVRPSSLREPVMEAIAGIARRVRTRRPRHPVRLGRRPRGPPLVATSATCSPRCRCSPASIRERPGDAPWDVAATVVDPEIPVLTIEDLGVLRTVEEDGDRVRVELTPTYSGCPAIDAMRDDVRAALQGAGYTQVDVRMVLSPAWTTDWMTDDGKRKLREFGIAPPNGTRAGARRTGRRAHGGEVPALRLARHPRARALRLDLVQGALRVPRLPRAVRLLQGAVDRAPRPGRRPPPRALPRARGRGGAPADGRQRRGDASRCRRSCTTSTTTSPGSTSRCGRPSTGTSCGAATRSAGRRALAAQITRRHQARPRRPLLDLGEQRAAARATGST